MKGFYSPRLLSTTCLTAAMLCAAGPVAYANPVDGVVAAGSAAITEAGKKLDIHQHTDKVVIDWRSFDIELDEHTEFHQPNSGSIALNRVNSANPSNILGKLTANGNVVIVNQNGVLFGAGAVVDVNGIVATTADIDNNAFMQNGPLHFDKPGNPEAAIVNQGLITAKDAGLVGLVAPNVINSGIISAKMGRVHLASGDTATVDFYGDNLLEVAVSDAVNTQFVGNKGLIEAAGGKIALTAAAGSKIVNSLIIVEGELRAPAIAQRGGEIIIYAEGSNAVKNNVAADKGKKTGSSNVMVSNAFLSVSGRNAGERGGNITITGDNVGIMAGTFIDASGYEGLSGTTDGKLISDHRIGSAGGDIRIGGDYLGQGDTATALNLYVDQDAFIFNDATHSGDAGRTIFWSDNDTYFYGNVFARALGGKSVDILTGDATSGGNAGMGGFVETSGHHHLDASGYVNLTASDGNRGTYFLDPTNITIYGNVDPAFISTDTTLNLSTNLRMWLDASDTTKVNLTYQTMSTTATGTSGHTTITVGSNSGLEVGARVRLGGAGSVTAASTLGADTYTITNISGTTITLSSALTQSYSGVALYQGYVNQLTDKSTNANNATAGSATLRPVWVSNGQNGLGTLNFNGTTNLMSVANAASLNPSTLTFMLTARMISNRGHYDSIFGKMTDYNWNNGYGFNSLTQAATTKGFWVNNYLNNNVQFNNPVGAFQSTGMYDLTNVSVYLNGLSQGADPYNGALSNSSTPLLIGGAQCAANCPSNVAFSELALYGTALSTDARNLVEQYQSAKWGIALTPPGTGADEVSKATASDGYSVFTTRYLERLSASANISLQASTNITLDLKGDTLALSSGKSLTLTAGNNISSASTGTITTTGADITMTAGGIGLMSISNLTLNTVTSGNISLTSGSTMTTGVINSAGTVTLSNSGSSTDISVSGAINSTTGNVSLTAGRDITLSSGIATTSGNVSLSSARHIATTAGITTTGGDITLRSRNANAASGYISIAGAITSGGGKIIMGGGNGVLSAGSGYAIGSNGSGTQFGIYISNVGVNAGGGDIIMNGQGGTYSDYNYGINIGAGTSAIVRTSGTGTITLTGIGGTTSAATNFGVRLGNGGTVYTGSGTLTLNGTAGTGSTIGVNTDTSAARKIGDATQTGNIVINSTGDINLDNVAVRTGGSGTISLSSTKNIITSSTATLTAAGGDIILRSRSANAATGYIQVSGAIASGGGDIIMGGGNGAISADSGYAIGDSAPLVYGTQVGITIGATTVNAGGGDIIMNGRGGTYGSYNIGVYNTGTVYTSSTGIITMYGTGGTVSHAGNVGIRFQSGGTAYTGSGTLTLVGTAGTGSDGGVHLGADGYAGNGSQTGNIVINSIGGNNGYGLILGTYGIETAGTILLTSTKDINLGNIGYITSTSAGTAITLVAGQNLFLGTSSINASNGRWLMYSTNPASNTNSTTNAQTSDFRRFSCTYGVSCPAMPATGNGLLYTYTPTVIVTPGTTNVTYGDNFDGNYTTYGFSGYLGSDQAADVVTGTLTGTSTYAAGANAGTTHNINYTGGTLSSAMGYAFTYANNASALVVLKKNITATLGALTKTYGDNNPTLDYTNFTFSGLVSAGHNALFTAITPDYGAVVAGTGVGTYAVNAAIGDTTNYHVTSVTGANLTIGKATLNVNATAGTKVYGAVDSLAYTHSGLVAGDTDAVFSGALSRAAGSDVGTYAILQNTLAAGGNYNIVYTGANYAITKATLNINATAGTKVYGTADGALAYTHSGLTNGDTDAIITGALSRAAGGIL